MYSLLSLAATVFGNVYNQNVWWIDFSFLPSVVSALAQLLLTLSLGFFALHVPRHIIARLVMAVPVLAGLITAIYNTVEVYLTALSGRIILGFPLPFSFFVSVVLLCILFGVLLGHTYLPSADKPGKAKVVLAVAITCVVVAILFPVGQMYCFGTTNYRMKVDATVVFGAQVYPNGVPSPVLQDRLDTAIQFYKDGWTPVLVMSGGIDVDGTSEAEAMRNYAIEQGVAPADIIIDENGENTKLTARNTVATLRAAGYTNVAAVSNFYHLARIKMLYLADGMDVRTVPSVPRKDPSYPLFNVVREIPGWWYYWLQNLVE